MARAASPAGSEDRSRRPLRLLLLLLVVLAGAAVVLWVFVPRLRVSRWIADLHAVNPQTVKAARDALRSADDPRVDVRLAEGLDDADLPFAVRVTLGQILLERNRLPAVETVLREGSPVGRRAALATLYSQAGPRGLDWFQRDYVTAEAYGAESLLLDWLANPRDASRATPARIAGDVGLEAAVPALRRIVREGDDLGSTRTQRAVLAAAAQALLRLGDCEAVASFVAPAMAEPNDVVRLRVLQTLHRAVRGPQPLCPDAVPAARVREALVAALDGPPHTLQGALLLLETEPAWALELEDRLLAILDGEPESPFHRRHALEALAASGSASFARRLPRYFHHPDPYVRSEAAMAGHTYLRDPDAPLRYVDAWIGLLEDERENENAFYTSMGGLRDAAGRWLSLSPELVAAAARGEPAWRAFREELFRTGRSGEITRERWAEEWWRWWASSLGLDEAERDAAWGARRAARAAVREGDAEGARRALETSPRRDAGLFTYVEGWLDREG